MHPYENGFPVNMMALDTQIERAKAAEPYEVSGTNVKEGISRSFQIQPLTEAGAVFFKDMVYQRAGVCTPQDYWLEEIIWHVCRDFLVGKMDSEEAVAVLQSKIDLYRKEIG